MEASVFIRGVAQSAEHMKQISLMFSDNAPIFSEEVAVEWRFVFNALEEIFTPETIDLYDGLEVEFSWLMGSNFDEDMLDSFKQLHKAGLGALVGYYWADDVEGFAIYRNGRLNEAKNWKSRFSLAKLNSGSDRYLSKCLSTLVGENTEDISNL